MRGPDVIAIKQLVFKNQKSQNWTVYNILVSPELVLRNYAFKLKKIEKMDCFEPVFGFLMQVWLQKYRSDTWDPKAMFSAPSGGSTFYKNLYIASFCNSATFSLLPYIFIYIFCNFYFVIISKIQVIVSNWT